MQDSVSFAEVFFFFFFPHSSIAAVGSWLSLSLLMCVGMGRDITEVFFLVLGRV